MSANKKVERPGVREGYDLWATSYDSTPNPLVALDRRYTMDVLSPGRGEAILDAACGTGQNLKAISLAGSKALGVDLSRGMLQAARAKLPGVPLVQTDLDRELPFRQGAFDAILCALVGEHLTRLRVFFRGAAAALKPGGRLVFSVFHPEMAAAGVESNFERAGVEYRLGAQRHTASDYLSAIAECGFDAVNTQEFRGDEALAREIPWAVKYVGRPLLLVIEGRRKG